MLDSLLTCFTFASTIVGAIVNLIVIAVFIARVFFPSQALRYVGTQILAFIDHVESNVPEEEKANPLFQMVMSSLKMIIKNKTGLIPPPPGTPDPMVLVYEEEGVQKWVRVTTKSQAERDALVKKHDGFIVTKTSEGIEVNGVLCEDSKMAEDMRRLCFIGA